MRELRIRDSFIKLCQALKLSGICQTGTDAKYYIESGNVRVNGEAELRRGKKLYDKDQVSIITEDGKEEEFVIFAQGD